MTKNHRVTLVKVKEEEGGEERKKENHEKRESSDNDSKIDGYQNLKQ